VANWRIDAMSDLDPETLAFAARVFDAARTGAIEEFEGLLAHGFPPNLANDKGDTLLMLASYHGHAALVRLLIAHGADPARLNDRGQTPLAGAAFKGYADVVEALLDGGAPVDQAGPDGRTALMTAAMFNRIALVRTLLARGADPGRRDVSGATAADAAQAMGAADAAAIVRPGALPLDQAGA
jgi:ankyrin repeat protein